MRRILCVAAVTAVATLCFAAVASASPLQNGDFETGNTSGWTTSTDSGSVIVTTGADDGTDTSQFAVVTAGGEGSWQTLSQTFDATAGQTLHLQTAFKGAETETDACVNGYDDQGQVTIEDGGDTTTVFSADACDTIGFGGWQTLAYKVTTTGEITLTAEVQNVEDSNVPSQIFLDNVSFGGSKAVQYVQVDHQGYCSVAGNTYPSTDQPIPPGTFLVLKVGQADTDSHYKGATPAIYVEGEGITCDPPPAGYVQDGYAGDAQHVGGGFYPYYVPGSTS